MNDKRPQLELINRDRNTIVSSILIEKIYKDGSINSVGSRYVRVFRIGDINYKLSDNKNLIDEAYKNVINSIDKNVEISLIIDSKKISKKFIEEKVMLKHIDDKFNYLRDGINETIAKNSSIETLVKDKYMVIAFTEDRSKVNYKGNAINRMNLISNAIKRSFESISDTRLMELTQDETIKLFYNLYNKDRIEDKLSDENCDLISEKTREELGISYAELIAPKEMIFYRDFIKMNSKYIVALHLDDINKQIDTDTMERLTDNNFPAIIGLKERAIDALTTSFLIGRELGNIEGEIYDIQRRLAESKVSVELIPQMLKLRREEAIRINENIKTRNDVLFDMGLYALVYCDSIEECIYNWFKRI